MRSIYLLCRVVCLFCLTLPFLDSVSAQCDKPTDLSVTNITDSSANLAWLGHDDTVVDFEVEIRSKGRTPKLKEVHQVASSTIGVDGLSPGSEYRFRVRSNCLPGGTSGSTKWFAFKTTGLSPEEPCRKATDLEVLSATMTTATLSWSGSQTSEHYEIEVRSKGSTPVYFFEKSLIDTSITIFGLDPNGKYQFRVRTTCENSAVSGSTTWHMFIPADVDEEETCPFAKELQVDSITLQSAVLTWIEEDQNTVYVLSVVAEDEQDTLLHGPVAAPVSIDSLLPDTEYSVHLIANCVDGVPSQVSISFKTLEESLPDSCGVPNNLDAALSDTGIYVLTWDTIGSAITYQLQIADRDTVPMTLVDTTIVVALYQFSAMDSMEGYSFRVRALCSMESFSEYSQWFDFPADQGSQFTAFCDTPQYPGVDTVIGNNAFVSWLASETDHYQLEVQNQDSVWDTEVINSSTEPMVVLSDLAPNSDYQVRIASLCGRQSSAYSEPMFFSTFDAQTICLPPTDLASEQIDESTVVLNWDGEDSVSYEVEVTPVDTGSTLKLLIPSFESNVLVSGLHVGLEYQYRVRQICSEGDTSLFSNWIVFSTEEIEEICEEPSEIQIDSISATSAWLSWSGQDTVQYQLFLTEMDTIAAEPVEFLTNDHFIYFDSLMPQTEYEINIRAICDNDLSSMSVTFSFTTLEGDISPDSCQAPIEFQLDSVDATAAWISWEGPDSLIYLVEVAGEDFEWQNLVGSPSVSLIDLPSDADFSVRVRVICSDIDTSDWSEDFIFQTLVLSVDPEDSCTIPVAEILHLDSTSALFDWTSSSSGAFYLLEVENIGYTPHYNLITTTRDTGYQVIDLLPGGTYQWKVAAFCEGGEYSDCTPWMTFTTEGDQSIECLAPVGLSVEHIGDSTAILHWNEIPGALDYEVEIENLDTTLFYSLNTLVVNHSVVIDSLSPGGLYQFKVNVQCLEGSISEDSEWFVFDLSMSQDTGGIQAEPQSVQMAFPNPARTTMTVKIPEVLVGSETTIELNDMMGRVVLANKTPQVSNGDLIQFEVDNLLEGIYKLTVRTETSHFHELIFISK